MMMDLNKDAIDEQGTPSNDNKMDVDETSDNDLMDVDNKSDDGIMVLDDCTSYDDTMVLEDSDDDDSVKDARDMLVTMDDSKQSETSIESDSSTDSDLRHLVSSFFHFFVENKTLSFAIRAQCEHFIRPNSAINLSRLYAIIFSLQQFISHFPEGHTVRKIAYCTFLNVLVRRFRYSLPCLGPKNQI